MLIKRRKIPLFTLRELTGSSFEQTLIRFTQGCIVLSLVEIGPLVQENKIFKILSMYFCYFVVNSPWRRAGPSFKQT